MAIPVGMNRVVFVGHLPSGEIFNTSFWTFGNNPANQADANVWAARIASLFQTQGLATARGMIPSTAGYDTVKTYHYPTGGPNADLLGAASIVGGTGTGASAGLPEQTCIVVSLRTGYAGRSARGRMYLPCLTSALANHQIAGSLATSIANDMAGFLGAVGDDINEGTPMVLSQVGAGSYHQITQTVVDTRPDIQRRRANRQVIASTATGTL